MVQVCREARMVRQKGVLTTAFWKQVVFLHPRNRAWFLALFLSATGCQGGLDLRGPTLEIEQGRPVGLAPSAVLISAADASGVSSLIIKQRDTTTEKLLLDREYSPAASSVTEELLLSAAVDVSFQNQILLLITARDSAGHITSQEVAVPFSDKVPEISIVSAPSSLTEGEPAIAVVRAKGDSIESVGLMFGSTTLPGTRLKSLKMDGADDQFVILFSAPLADERSSIRAYSRNSALNTNSVPLPTSVRSAPTQDKRIRMKNAEIADLIASTTDLLSREAVLLNPALTFSSKGLSPETPRNSFFGPVFDIYKAALGRLLRRKTSSYEQALSPLLKPKGDLIAPFGSRITIVAEDGDYPLGLLPFEIREVGGASVESIGEGRVLFNEHLGPLGSFVGVDMGMGLIITYGFLESSSLSIGARVLPRGIIGIPHRRPGASFGTYFLGAFIGGRAANPAPFSDKDWFQSTIGKLLTQ